MEAYQRLYSDPKSPLTPLATMTAFTFTPNTKSSTKTLTPHNTLTPNIMGSTMSSRNAPQKSICSKPVSNGKLLDVPGSVKTARQDSNVNSVIGKYHLSPYYTHMEHSKTANSTTLNSSTSASSKTAAQRKLFKKASPVAPKPISTIMERVLIEHGLDYLTPLFEQQEIDFDIFQTLTRMDLQQIGITRMADVDSVLNAVDFAQSYI